MEFSAIKETPLKPAIVEMNLENIMLSEKDREEFILYDSIYMKF